MKPIFKPAFLLLITIALLSFIQFNSSFATDLASSTNNQINNSNQLSVNSFPSNLIYAEYFKNRDKLTWKNIKDCLNFKLMYLKGRRPKPEYTFCHIFQRRTYRAIDRFSKENQLPVKEIDNDFLFGKDSEINKILTPQKQKDSKCVYHSFGDLTKGCVMYCDYHGVDFESDFFKEHKKEFEASQPYINSDDIAELILFSPTLIFLAFIIILVIPKKKNNSLLNTKK